MTRCFFLAAFFLVLIFLSAAPHAEEKTVDGPRHPDGRYGYDESLPDLLSINNLSYKEARAIVIREGWSPLQTLQEGSEDYKQGAMSGNGPLFWNKGYRELQTCSGTGAAYCAFLFQNKNGDKLRVVTKGEESEGGSNFAKVVGGLFNP